MIRRVSVYASPRDPYPTIAAVGAEHEMSVRPQRLTERHPCSLLRSFFLACITSIAQVRYFALMQCLLNTYRIRAPSTITPPPLNFPPGRTPRANCTSKRLDLDISYAELGKYFDQIRNHPGVHMPFRCLILRCVLSMFSSMVPFATAFGRCNYSVRPHLRNKHPHKHLPCILSPHFWHSAPTIVVSQTIRNATSWVMRMTTLFRRLSTMSNSCV
ncbi:hypothetical protein EDB83DRAFT_63918 [Lactarius deliciosus]|nr:hypothetical protein EDB83DRAFT_63918 [Lactarius deliciosus]